MKEVTCNNCSRVHFAMSLDEVLKSVKLFNEMYVKLSDCEKLKYYGNKPTTLESYKDCFYCGNSYKNFRLAKDSDSPFGITLNPILEYNNG